MHWKLFADLAEAAGGREIPVAVEPGATVGEALDALLADHPALADRVLDGDDLVEHVNLLHNGANVFTEADGLATELSEGDELALFPPVSGG
jgi:molybdopterin synthase sulfur carrier subunit